MADSRARVWFALFVLAVFCVGGALGIVIGRRMAPAPPFGPRGFDGRGRGGPGIFEPVPGRPPLGPIVLERLTSALNLDADQTARVKQILDERRDRLEQVHREARERFEKEQRELHAAIRAVLRPDQQQTFDHFLEHRR